jgi:plasmid stabilization system protein ParE
MTPSYSIRALARADLEEIWLFTFKEWGVEQAEGRQIPGCSVLKI